MDKKQNFDHDISGIICDKDFVVENETLKVKIEEAGDENSFLGDKAKNITLFKCKDSNPFS